MSNEYLKAGVDVEAGYESVALIKEDIAKTSNIGTVSSIGGFGAIFDIKPYNYKDPLLVSATDGVGTKLELANELQVYNTIGIDLVAMCVNDIVTIGAQPLYFLDYIAVDKNIPSKIKEIVFGICQGLKQCDCALIGGETAEMPGVYHPNGFDLAGYVTGIVERELVINNQSVCEGDCLIGVASSGIHSNGYSLVRKIIKDNNLDLNKVYPQLSLDMSLGEVLLTPTKIYVLETLNLIKKVDVKGIAHITGGGFDENIKRITNKFGAKIKKDSFNILPIFNFLQEVAQIEQREMFGYFNMGIGMVYIVDSQDVNSCLNILKEQGLDAYEIGVVSREKDIEIW